MVVFFGSIPHADLLKSVARRIVDRRVLHLIKMWLDCPVKMSRTAATKAFTLADHEAATAGVECRKDEGVLDEPPGAYKDVEAVMRAQSDLVDIIHTLKQVVCVKG